MNSSKINIYSKSYRLVLSAVMVAAATALSFAKLYEMPLGGSVTLASMLPILLVGYLYGPRWGMLTGFVYGIIQLLTGGLFTWGLNAATVAGSIVLDYLLAYSLIGLAGIYGRGFVRYILGIVSAVAFRFVSHVLSGVILFSSDAFNKKLPAVLYGRPLLYSLAYNGAYLLPDLAICLVAAVLIYKPLVRLLKSNPLT